MEWALDVQSGNGEFKRTALENENAMRSNWYDEVVIQDEGQHTLEIRAWDRAGNMSTSLRIGVVVARPFDPA